MVQTNCAPIPALSCRCPQPPAHSHSCSILSCMPKSAKSNAVPAEMSARRAEKAPAVNEVSSESEDAEPTQRKRGRPVGATGFSSKDMYLMFEIIEYVLPMGQQGWAQATEIYNERAEVKRSATSLERKYKRVSSLPGLVKLVYGADLYKSLSIRSRSLPAVLLFQIW